MKLSKLLERSEYTLVQGTEDTEISTLVYDSRKVRRTVFLSAFPGQPLTDISLLGR